MRSGMDLSRGLDGYFGTDGRKPSTGEAA